MVRALVAIGLLALALVPPGRGGPVDGTSWSRQRVPEGNPGVLQFSKTFVAGQRACVIVIGDHKPVVELEVKVYDSAGKVVAEDRGHEPAQDYVAAMWYPPRQETYRIEVRNYGKDYNECSIAVK